MLDALLDPAFFGRLPDRATIAARLEAMLAGATALEDVLDRVRIFGKEQAFLIGIRVIAGTVGARAAGFAYADLAELLVARLIADVRAAFEAVHGCMAGGRIALVAMGKLGGREMTAASDLDLLLLYDFDEGEPSSDGGRPLTGSQYFARLTQRLIAAISAPTAEGRTLCGRFPPAALRQCRPARDPYPRLHRLSGERGLDLGAHGADAGAADRR